MEAISKEFMEEYDRGLKQNALVPLNGKVDQLDRTVVKQVRVGDTSYSPENGVVILPEGGSGDAQYTNKVFLEENGGVLTQAMVNAEDTTYVIQHDYTISNNIAILSGCTLEFAGGSLNGGSLSGTVEIINKPADLYEKVNCMELYVTNETHLCVADISELFDRYDKDDLISQDAITGRYSLAHFYCIAGMNKIIYRCPAYAFDNSQGTSYPALPYMRYCFYDRDFKLIDVRPEWTGRNYLYSFTNIPAGAVYINVLFSEDDQLNKPMILQDVLKYMYFNFLDNTKVYINLELKNDADVIDFTASGRWGSSEIYYNSYSDASLSDTYHIGKYSKGNLSTGSYFIPRSILKNYDFIQLVGHGAGATYTFIDGSTSEERNYNSMIIAFLKKTPLGNGEVIEYCDTYPWRIDLSQQQSPILAIPEDCKCIFIYKAYAWQGTISDCSPKQILLKKKSACDIGGFDTTDLSKISNRDVNTQEIKFVHWNIGADNIGGLMPRQEQVTSELLTKRRDSFNAFFNKINRTHNLLFNELNYWFDSAHSIDYMSLSASSVWQGKKRFDMRQYQNLGIFYKNDLLEYNYGTFECLKGFTEMGTSSVRGGRYYSYGYAIYHYSVAGANLYVMHTHLPTPISANSMKKLYREMKTIMDQYPNAVIVGDMNDSGNFNPYTHTGNNFLNLEEIFPASSGWHIANKELDDTPTLDFGKDFWNPTQPAAGRINLILDFCLWKGSYITMSDFRVRRDAIIVGSEALESTENAFINSSGSAEGNEALLNHRLSDHWPVEFTIKSVSSYSIVPDTEGSTRYNPTNKKFQWHNGEEWKDAGSEGGGGGTAQYTQKVFLPENGGVLTQAMVNTANTVYVIQHDYTISNNIAIPGGCTLEFAGGSLNGGSLSGTVEIINKPADLYEKVNCMELYVTNETHLCVADISEVFDRYDKDDLISQDAIANRYSLAHFYCIAGMDKIIFRCPAYAFDNSSGTSYPALPYMRYGFYDRDFQLIDVRPEWAGRDYLYSFTNIPEGAVYINVWFSTDDQLNKPMILQDVLKYMYFNFLDNTKVYINLELKNDADVIDFTASGRWSSSEIYYNSYSDPSLSDTYHIGKYSKGNLSTGSYFIPRSILKNYDFIQLVGHGIGATYTFDDGSTTEEREYSRPIIAFLKKTPIENGEVVEYCDTYPWRIDLHQQQSPILAIPDDCKCIFVYKAYAWQGTINDCSPKQILLKKKSACDIGGFDTTDLSKISNRDVNTQEIKFVHWNIGADNIGGLMQRQEQATQELLEKRRDSFNAFFNKINRAHNLLFNEFNYWFDSAHSIDYMSLSASSVWHGKKRFDMRIFQNLGIFYKNDLLEYRYGTFECLKGFTEMGTGSVRGGRYYSYGYTLYHYPVAGTNLYVMSTHLPIPISAASLKKIYREMKSIMEQYPNAVIVGDMNDSGSFNTYTHTGNNFANIEEVFTEESGWHIANKELDDTPTYDLGKDYWNPTQPAAGRLGIILDFCVWKGNYITMSDFRVRKDAIIVGSEALEATEGVFINDSGDVEGNEDYINHRLSDHWPVEFTIKSVSSDSIVPDTEGSTRYNPTNKKFQWHNGEEWKNAGGEGGGGGDYLPLTGGTLTGNLTIKGTYNLYRTNNGVSSIVYPGYRLYDTNGKLSSQFIGIVNPNGYNGFWISALNYNTNGTQVADKGFGFSVDKNGNGAWTVHEPSSFRTAIGINLDNLVVGKLKASAFLASNNGEGTHGTAGWVCLANITVNSTWASQPLKFRVTQRGKFGGELTLRFTNVATAADTEVYEFSYTGNIAGARIVKDGADFSLYIKKSESYDSIAISLVDVGAYMNGRVTVAWTDTFSASDPGGTVAVCRQTADDYDAFYCKVLNAAYGSITLSRNYSANGSNVSKRSNEVLANDNFHKGISGIYTITESDTDFVGFPVIVNHKDVLYIFYRRSEYHDLTPNQSTLDIYYKFSVDGGVNWSEEYSIQFPDTPNNTSGSSPSGWNGMHIDWRAYYYASYGNYIYGCTWGCVFYGDGSSSSDKKNYPSVLVRISQNNDKTLTLDKTQWFPEIVLWERDNAITFDSGRMNYYNRPTPNWDDYHGCLVGGPVTIKNGVMYIPVYYGSIGIVSWTINENLNVNSSNFKFVGSLTSSDYNSTAISGSESTVWIDDDGNIKTLVRFDRKSGELGSYKQSRIYSVDTVNKTYTELARCSMCEGPSSVMVESNMAIIIGRGPIAYSNIILYDNTKDEVVSELNQFDTPGYFTNWSDSFYGSISCRKGMYFIAFYKRLSSSKTTINYFTIDRLNLNLNNNYNNKESNTGNVVKKTDVSTDGNYQYLIPCAALVKKTPVYYFYVPNYINSKRVDLLGTIVFMTSFGTYRNQVDEGEQMTISLKDSVNAVCLLYEYKKRTNSSDSSKLDIDISISYKHGSSYVKYYRVISIANGFNGMLNPAIVANTSTDKSSCILSRLFVEGQTSDYRGYSISKAEGAEAEFDDSVYPDGVKIESSVHARIGAVGALVNGNPILSIVPDDDYAIDMASGNYIYTYTGFMQKASAQGFGYEPSCVSDFNDWILRSVDEVGQA